jgi:hypothetical protein
MGIFLLITLAAVTDWTIRLVVLNAKLSGRESYTEVMHHCFGHWGSAGVSFFQFAFAFGGYVICFINMNGWKTDDRMCAFSVIIGDTIPHVIAYLFPVLAEHAGLRLLVDRRVIIILCTAAVSFPLSLHRDIVKLSKSSGFGKLPTESEIWLTNSSGIYVHYRHYRRSEGCRGRTRIEGSTLTCRLPNSLRGIRGNRSNQFCRMSPSYS